MTYTATREDPRRRKRKPCSSDQPTAARWVTARHPFGTTDAPSALRMVNSARNVADRITSTIKACMKGMTNYIYKPRFEETDELYDEQTAAFAKLCTVVMDSADDGLRTLHLLTHHLYDDMCDKWTRRASSPQPCINLTLTNERKDHKALGFHLLN